MIEVFLPFFSSFPTGLGSGFDGTPATMLVPLLETFGFKLPAIRYLSDRYRNSMCNPLAYRYPLSSLVLSIISPSTTNLLATYILHGIFADVLLHSSDPARALSNNVVVKV